VRGKVLRNIGERALLRPGDRVGVAVSGGADSVALLRVLLELRSELGIVLAVAHFNHGLRGEQAAADEAFVAELATQHGLECFIGHGDVRTHASTNKLTVEAAGRDLRYRWFAETARQHRLDRIATAHTLDDQAETVLLKFLRGAGTRGLAGIYPIVNREAFRIVRPLLCVSRAEVEEYLSSLAQPWREDESNLDRRFLRNRVRHELLPLLAREYNPNIRQLLADVADLSQAEEHYWDGIVQSRLSTDQSSHELSLEGFAQLPVALQRRLLKRFAGSDAPRTTAGRHGSASPALDFEHVERLRRCALGELRRVELPGGRIAARWQGWLRIGVPQMQSARAYHYMLPIPGEVHVGELRMSLRALIVPEEFAREMAHGTLLNRDLAGAQLQVRNWRHGDRYRPCHRRSEEKLKRLLAEERIPAEQRPGWPVALHADNIVWVRGLSVASGYEWKGDGDAVKLEVIPLEAR